MRAISLILAASLAAWSQSEHDELLSSLKRKKIELDYKQAQEDASALRYDWVNQITGSYSETHNRDYDPNQKTKTFSVTVNQPVFKSGGIYYGIKYANATESYQYSSIKQSEKELIQSAINLIYSLRKADLQIAKQTLQVENAKIDVERKQEQFVSGFLDSSTLDSAIVDKNTLETSLLELESSRASQMQSLKNISDSDYKSVDMPKFDVVEKETYLAGNIPMRVAQEYTFQQEYRKKGIITTYFPTLSLTAGYYDTEYENAANGSNDGNSYSTVGFSLSMPLLDVNTFNTIESYRIDYLKASIQADEQKRTEINLYENILADVDIIQKKIDLSQSNLDQYASLLESTQELYSAGEKTEYDVRTLENSKKIKALDIKIYEIDRQLKLLELYARMESPAS